MNRQEGVKGIITVHIVMRQRNVETKTTLNYRFGLEAVEGSRKRKQVSKLASLLTMALGHSAT